jgi:FAD/FMN-containing dehydrogenase
VALSSTSTDVARILRTTISGRVVTADDPEYDDVRASVYGPGLPAVAIVQPADAADVSRAVVVAAEHDLEIAVRSGGHSAAMHSSTDGGILLDMSSMKSIEIDPVARTAWAETGLTAGEVTLAAGAHGLAVGFGDTASVGIGGITLGGGIGYLVRKHGLTIDSLLAAEIVTADGQIRQIDAERDPDLFWAIRGGGGNFGVVTRFKYRLVDLPQVVGGILVLPATPEVIAGFMSAAEAAPDDVSAIANVMLCPPMPFVPEDKHGSLVVLVLMAHAGPAEEAEEALAPFRALAEPIADLLRPITYPEMYPPEEGGPPGEHPAFVTRTMFADHIDRDDAQLIVERIEEHMASTDAVMGAAQLRVLGGAMARVPVDATAFAHRASRILVNLAVMYPAGGDAAVHDAWVADMADALHQGDDGHYVNFVGPEGADNPRMAYPQATWDRLVEVKRRYDPTNLFRRNHNVAP